MPKIVKMYKNGASLEVICRLFNKTNHEVINAVYEYSCKKWVLSYCFIKWSLTKRIRLRIVNKYDGCYYI